MIDSFYTPHSLAVRLAEIVRIEKVQTLADFCIGRGELIKCAKSRFPEAEVFGVDVSEEVVKVLKGEFHDWHLAVCDFTDEESRESVSFLKSKKFDLVMLNPPFTCKGSIVQTTKFNGITFRVSTAMLFVLKSLQYLSDKGGLYAILPISCVHSQKDRKAWAYLIENYHACVIEEPKKVSFSKKCSPNIVLIYAGNYPVEVNERKICGLAELNMVRKIVRGCLGMQNLHFSDSDEAFCLIHTTNIKHGEITGCKSIDYGKTVEGPGILIPRVCNPNRSKVAILKEKERVVLSDCIILLQTLTNEDAYALKSSILANWDIFEQLYQGTCSRYTTLARLREAFGLNE